MISLVKKLNEYRDYYYNQNISLVSDKEYDRLFDQLKELEKKTGIVYSNSPTQTVGYSVVSSLNKVKHGHPLLSLDKTTDLNEFADYFGGKSVVLMAKMDGLTCSITYRNGELVLAESRGNGEVGEDITHNALVISNIPKKIPYTGEVVIDGECIIDYESFDAINAPLIENAEREAKEKQLEGKDYTDYIRKHTYANPRNLASGTVRQLNSEVAAKRNVRFVAWKLHSAKIDDETENSVTNYYGTSFPFLRGMGFDVTPYILIQGKEHFETAIKSIKEACECRGYPIDGMVGAFDDVLYGKSLGSTSHHPKHSLAFKFYQERNKTVLRDIEWSVSRTGMVNPVAILDPVEIDGTIVSRATLSNVSIIKELELGIGDEVTLIKANQIIPYITDNLTRSNTYEIPKHCPCCNSLLEVKRDTGREMLYCMNDECHQKIVDRLVNFAGKNGMDIVGLSIETINKLVHLNYLKSFNDIYELPIYKNALMCTDGFGKSRTENLINAIEKSKSKQFDSFIVAIGIPGVGKSAAKSIASHCESVITTGMNLILGLIDLCNDQYDWTCLEGFGRTTSDGINKYVFDHREEMMLLADHLNPERNASSIDANIFGGKSFCITGKLEIYGNREELVKEIEVYGGKITSGVTAKTSYLITNDKNSGSSKNAKALKYGTTVLSEKEFIELCKKLKRNPTK